MPRMFDILRGGGKDNNINGKKEKTSPKDSQKPPLNFPKEILKKAQVKHKKPEDHSLVSKKLISAVKKHGVDNQETAKEIYKNAIETIKGLLAKIRANEDLNPYMEKLYNLLDNIFNQLVLGDNLLNNIYEESEDEYYLPHHITNILILSSFLGINMGFNKSRLKYLGLASIFCDAGMDALRDIVGQAKKLSKEEYDLMKSHISKSLEVVQKIDSMDEITKETILTHHERIDGSGYLDGIKSDTINPYAKIIGLVDTYEAMTHERPYRERMNAHKTMKFLIDSLKDNFDHDAIKVLINKMSIYPIGSIVRLDTEELARVVAVRAGSPLRPVVMVIKDAFGRPVKERIIIDLSKRESPSIKGPI